PFDASGKTRHRVFHPAPPAGCPLEQIWRRNSERMRKLRQQKQADVSNPSLDETDMSRRNARGRRKLAQRELPLRSESPHPARHGPLKLVEYVAILEFVPSTPCHEQSALLIVSIYTLTAPAGDAGSVLAALLNR